MENNNNESMSLLEKVKYFFIKPSKLFQEPVQKSDYAISAIIISFLSAFGEIIQSPVVRRTLRGTLRGTLNSANTVNTARDKQLVNSIFNSIVNTVTNPVATAIGNLIGILILVFVSSAIYLLISKIINADIDYGKMIIIYLIAYIPISLRTFFEGIYTSAANSTFFIDNRSSGYISIFLKYDLFKVWQVVILIIGIAVLGKVSKKKAAAGVVTWNAIGLLFAFLGVVMANVLKAL